LFEEASSSAGAAGLPRDLVEKTSKLIARHKKQSEASGEE